MVDNLDQLAQEILSCQRCDLRFTATRPVPGFGQVGAKYFLLGEAPGREEDEAGVPFVGSAGRRLDNLLALAGINLNECYLSNTVRCRPPQNRDPRKREIKACAGFLWRELKLVKPQYVITLGTLPLSVFCPQGVRQMHGTMFEYELPSHPLKLTIIAQYHPAAALHQPRLWAQMLDDWENMPEVVPHDFKIVQKLDTSAGLVALDTEQDGQGGLGHWSLATRDGETKELCVLPLYGPQKGLGPLPYVAMHNAKYDLRVLRANGLPKPDKVIDTMIMAYCLGLGRQAPKDDSKSRSGSDMVGGLGLKYLARRHLGMQMKSWEQVKDYPEEIPEYNAKDSVATYLLAEKWLPQIPNHFWSIDMPLLEVLMAMEDRGIKIDPDYLQEYVKELDSRLAAFDLPLNPFSTSELQSYIYGGLGIEPWKFTESGAPSVDSDVLEQIHDPVIEQVLKFKELYKDKGTYVDNYVRLRGFNDRIHPEFKQVSTSAGRISCARPNIQNVDKEGNLRKLFVADRGKKLVRIDYDQLEWRVLAAVTEDPVLLKALTNSRKIHQVTADELGVSYDVAKNANFAIQYGARPWMLAQTLGVTIEQARSFLERYFKRFPGVKRYQEKMREIALSERRVTNWFGRTRRIDAMYVEQKRVQEEGIKEAINTPIQGTAADIVKLAMIDLHYNHNAPMIVQVHDELLFEVPAQDAQEYARWLEGHIPTLVEINGVKFPVSATVGDNWKECTG
jgi:uracil-DNA glycosylase family 4